MSDIKTFSFTNDTTITRKVEKMKGKKGVKYRFGFPLFEGIRKNGKEVTLSEITPSDMDNEEACVAMAPLWVGHWTAYVPGVGHLICDNNEVKSFIQEKTDSKPKMRVGTVIASYPLDAKGNINFDSIREDPSTIEIKPFIVDVGKYETIKKIHASDCYYLWNNDLTVQLANDAQESFQKWEFSIPSAKSAFSLLRKLMEKAETGTPEEKSKWKPTVDYILSKTQEVFEKELIPCMGREVSIKELKEKLGLSKPAAQEVEISSDEDVEDALSALNL